MRVLVLVGLMLVATVASADTVSLKDGIQSATLRGSPNAGGAAVGKLIAGAHAELLGSVPRWYRVRLSTDIVGYVSKQSVLKSVAPVLEVPPFSPSYIVDTIDVGTGLAAFVKGPDFTVLYDGGSNDDAAIGKANRLIAYLKSTWPDVKTIDHVIVSHPHKDHVELLADVVEQFQVRNLWDSGRLNDICGYRALLNAASKEEGLVYHNALSSGPHVAQFRKRTCGGRGQLSEKVELQAAELIDAGSVIPLGSQASMVVLHANGEAGPDINDNSLVVRMDLGRTRILFMGDAGGGGRSSPNAAPKPTSIEGVLLTCCASEIKADVLIAGHHGSKTSSRQAFLAQTGARTFVVSSGPKKYSGVMLPDDEVIQELEARGVVLRTDMDDEDCGASDAKVGPDQDGKPGGCSNVRINVGQAGIDAQYIDLAD